jgi:hypothetical protein
MLVVDTISVLLLERSQDYDEPMSDMCKRKGLETNDSDFCRMVHDSHVLCGLKVICAVWVGWFEFKLFQAAWKLHTITGTLKAWYYCTDYIRNTTLLLDPIQSKVPRPTRLNKFLPRQQVRIFDQEFVARGLLLLTAQPIIRLLANP